MFNNKDYTDYSFISKKQTHTIENLIKNVFYLFIFIFFLVVHGILFEKH